ncbi:MAG: primosomal protein N' [Saprospiraceae bacterium]|nr:primosomal protein N' [Saprospiraceae bacterium]
MSTDTSFHPVTSTKTYVDVVLPLALPMVYTYAVPEDLIAEIIFGGRVEVPFGKNKLYSGIVVAIHHNKPHDQRSKLILSVLDDKPVISKAHWDFWKWVASYYVCTPGEVMQAALPAHLKLESQSRLVISPLFDNNMEGLTDNEFLIVEALSIQQEISLEDVQKILNVKSVTRIINGLLDKKLVYLKSEIKEKFKPKVVACVRLVEPFLSQPELLAEAFDLVQNSERQTRALMGFIQLSKKEAFVTRPALCKAADVDSGVIAAIEKKEIWEVYDRTVSRIGGDGKEGELTQVLSAQQEKAIREMDALFKEKEVVLLHGVTGSGKTRIYIEYIKRALEAGEQVLYLLPEIALTTQIIQRLQAVFGEQVAVYHSKLNNNERVEVWKQVASGQKPVVLGARSALFLPFTKLQWIIVDEEHDGSFKQHDPAPRYNGRDAAIFLASLFKAKTMLGTATPSVETYYNAKKGKYGLVEMKERFGGLDLPKLHIADVGKEMHQRSMQSHFTSYLIDNLKEVLEHKEQAILFQNRRGYAPTVRCEKCNWHKECIHCDVSMTYHKLHGNLQCHYCGYQAHMPQNCPACGSNELKLTGIGTEKIEDELKIYLPEARIGRMDLDTVRTKNAHAKIIGDFEQFNLDILVGTQMVTKGLDFDKVKLVGIINADQLWSFPDFRASERAFQLIAQVAGRAGRKNEQGKVIVQARNITHPILKDVLENDFHGFFEREIMERKSFAYPPFARLITITLKHKKPDVLNYGAKLFTNLLKDKLGERVKGPAVPFVGRIRGYYLLDVLLKLELNGKLLKFAKETILEAGSQMKAEKGYSGIRINVDVDPY